MNKRIMDQINQVSLDIKSSAFRNDIDGIITQAVEQIDSYEQIMDISHYR